MGPPTIIWGVGAWTPERLCRLAAAALLLVHALLGGRLLFNLSSGALAAAAQVALLIFFALLYFEYFPIRIGLLVAIADGGLGAGSAVIEILRAGDWIFYAAAALFLIGLGAGAMGFRKLPRPERW